MPLTLNLLIIICYYFKWTEFNYTKIYTQLWPIWQLALKSLNIFSKIHHVGIWIIAWLINNIPAYCCIPLNTIHPKIPSKLPFFSSMNSKKKITHATTTIFTSNYLSHNSPSLTACFDQHLASKWLSILLIVVQVSSMEFTLLSL